MRAVTDFPVRSAAGCFIRRRRSNPKSNFVTRVPMSLRRAPVMNAHTVQRQMDLRRAGDSNRLEMQKRHEQDVAMSAAATSESRVEVWPFAS